jgi:hypothetical protein
MLVIDEINDIGRREQWGTPLPDLWVHAKRVEGACRDSGEWGWAGRGGDQGGLGTDRSEPSRQGVRRQAEEDCLLQERGREGQGEDMMAERGDPHLGASGVFHIATLLTAVS